MEIRTLPTLNLVGIRHVGPYPQIGEAFERLGKWLQESRIWADRMVAVYYDNPAEVPADQLRSDACVEIPGGTVVASGGEARFLEVPGGDYACMRYVGPYSGLPEAWASFLSQIPGSGYHPVCGPSLEIYVNDCNQVAPEELITELYQPVGR